MTMQLQYATMISMLRSCLLRSRHLSPSLVKQCGPVSAQRVMSSANKDQASLTGGHVQYVKGVAEEAIGNMTGSKDWQQSGQQDKQAAVDEMRSASSDRKDAQEERAKQGGGWVEKEGAVEAAAGKLSGCQGMQQEGEMKKHGGTS